MPVLPGGCAVLWVPPCAMGAHAAAAPEVVNRGLLAGMGRSSRCNTGCMLLCPSPCMPVKQAPLFACRSVAQLAQPAGWPPCLQIMAASMIEDEVVKSKVRQLWPDRHCNCAL